MTNEEMQDKIAKLLAKAEGTDNAEEAQAYSEKAERLMLKWGIEEAQIRGRATGAQRQQEEIRVDRQSHRGSYHQAEMRLVWAVAEGLGGLQALQTRTGRANETVSILIGYDSDILRARALAASLMLQATSARKAWWRGYELREHLSTENERFLAQREFLMSFARTVGQRLSEMRVEETAAAESRTAGTELALVDRDAQVKEALGKHFPKLGTARGLRGTGHGRAAGREAGKRANLGGTGIGGAKGALTH